MTLPSWYTPDPSVAPAAAPVAAPSGATPDWYQPEPQAAAVAAQPSDWGAAKNFLTGLARVPGAIVGLPAALVHAKHWADAKVENAATGGNKTATQLDAENPLTSALPTAEGVDNAVFKATGTQPYAPTTTGGKLGQALVTGVGAGAVDPLADWSAVKNIGEGVLPALKALFKANAGNAVKTGVASAAAEGAHEIAPNSDILPVAAALAAHSGTGLATDAARSAGRVVRPIFVPRAAAETAAANVLRDVPDNAPLANPSDADVQGAVDQTKAQTDALGSGLDDYTAGGNIRQDLQARKDALTAQRSNAAEQGYAAFRAQPPMSVDRFQGFLSRPGFRRAMRDAGSSVLDEGGAPLTPYFSVENAGATGGADNVPGIRINAPAFPPDVLHRIKVQLDDGVNNAGSPAAQRTAKILRDQFVQKLDEFYPDTYPKAREDFAAYSRPLDPLTNGTPGKVLDSSTQYGNRAYTMPQDRIGDTFLKSRALRSDFDNLVSAYGGDRKAALGNLRENLVGKVQDAVNPDGTLSQDAFDRAVKPYTRALGMWFPDLAKQFNTAKAAQSSLDTLRAQQAVAEGVRGGALRDGNDVVTQDSFNKWLSQNQRVLTKTQDPNAITRLRTIAKALPRMPGAGAEAAVEGIPAAVGFSMGGSEAGIFGAMFHKIPEALAGPQMAKFKAEYSNLIESAVTNPKVRTDLAHRITSRPRGQTPLQAVGAAVLDRLKRGAAEAPLAVNAGAQPTQP